MAKSAKSESDRKWKRMTQISVIAVPIVMLIIFLASPLPEILFFKEGSEGNSPTGIQATIPNPVASSTMEAKPETQTIEPTESPQPEAQIVEFETQIRERNVERHFQNEHCGSSTNIKWEIQAAEGWQIDTTSLNLTPTSISSKSSYFGISHLTEDGFTMNGRVSNNGDCVKVLGKVIARDGRGHLTVAGTYTEVREVEVSKGG